MSAKNYVSERVAKRKEAAAERKHLMAELGDLKLDMSRLVDKQRNLKAKIKIYDAKEIEPEIRRLTREIETSTLTLQEEKKIVNQLRDLEASKPYVEEYNVNSQQMDQNKTRRDEIWTRANELKQLIEQYSDEINVVNSKVQESRDKLGVEIPEIEGKINEIKDAIQAAYDNKHEINKVFSDKKFAFEKQQKLIKHIEFVNKRKQEIIEREERRKAWEARQKEEEENKPIPWYFQIKQCDNYISFLEKLIPSQTSAEEAKTVPLEANVLPSKEERLKAEAQQYFGSVAKGKGKKKERVRKAQKPDETSLLNLPLDLLKFLSTLSIKAPYTIAEVPACAELLKTQREWYKTNPEPEGGAKPQSQPQPQTTPVHEERKTPSTLQQDDFPKPESAKAQQAYGIFKAELPTKPVKKEERGGRPSRRGGR
jgi:uncharacterized coiled-coil DUF342 family protein